MKSATVARIAESVRGHPVVWHSHRVDWDVTKPTNGFELSLQDSTHISEISASDAIVTVETGISVASLQAELKAHGQCLPISGFDDWTLAALLAFNLPHPQEHLHGAITDWILGLTVVLGDGLMATCGSRVVKNVAGYDVHKLLVGARGTLGVVVEVTMRTCPIASIRPVDMPPSNAYNFVQRTRLTDFAALVETVGSALVYAVPETATIWAKTLEAPARFEGDWIVQPGSVELRLAEMDLMRRAKAQFDPASRLNPGAMGIF